MFEKFPLIKVILKVTGHILLGGAAIIAAPGTTTDIAAITENTRNARPGSRLQMS